MNTPDRKEPRQDLCDGVFRRLARFASAASILGAIPLHQASAMPIIGGPPIGTIALTIDAGPLIVHSPGRFGITGTTYIAPTHISPGINQTFTITQPGRYPFTLFRKNIADSRAYYSLMMVDFWRRSTEYTLRFELLPGTCPSMSAVSNNVQLLVVAGRPLAFSVLRRPTGTADGPQLVSTPKVLCVNPQAEGKLLFYPMVDNYLPVEFRMSIGYFSFMTELVVPLRSVQLTLKDEF